MKQFEYKVVMIPMEMNIRSLEVYGKQIEAKLNQLGNEGWEFVQRTDCLFTLKREKKVDAQNAEMKISNQKQDFPAWRNIKGEITKVSLYTTKESIDKLNEVVDRIEAEYGCKRCYAIAYVLEEAAKLIGRL